MLVVGLTGGIGAGKSVVALLFAEQGVPIIDTDIIAREVTAKGRSALSAIAEHFGPTILLPDGELNRSALRQIIFNDPKERHWLERLVHPRIRKIMEQQIQALTTPYCIAVIPLLLEVEFYSLVNRILVVDASEQAQIERVMVRDEVDKSHIEAILKNQATRQYRTSRAHDIIVNDGDLEALAPQVAALHAFYLKLAPQFK